MARPKPPPRSRKADGFTPAWVRRPGHRRFRPAGVSGSTLLVRQGLASAEPAGPPPDHRTAWAQVLWARLPFVRDRDDGRLLVLLAPATRPARAAGGCARPRQVHLTL